MTTEFAVLEGRIRQALLDVRHIVERAEALLAKARLSHDDDYMDGAVPGGPNRHQELLQQMSAEIVEVRPPAIQVKTRYCLDEYRGFRHLVRNLYTFNLRPSRIAELCDGLRSCFDAVCGDLDAFARRLHELDAP